MEVIYLSNNFSQILAKLNRNKIIELQVAIDVLFITYIAANNIFILIWI